MSIKNKIIFHGVGTRASILGCFIAFVKCSFHRTTNILVGGDQTRRRDQSPFLLFAIPYHFNPPTAEVGGSVVTKYDRDSDPQRSRASHPISDSELRRRASEEGAL